MSTRFNSARRIRGSADRGDRRRGRLHKHFDRREVTTNPESLLAEQKIEQLTEDIFQWIRTNKLPPVVARDVYPHTKEQLWENLRSIQFVPATEDHKVSVLGDKPWDNYTLNSEFTLNDITHELVLVGGFNSYNDADRITDYYQEERRLDAYSNRNILNGITKTSPNRMWTHHDEILKKWIKSAVIRYTNQLLTGDPDLKINQIDYHNNDFQLQLIQSLFDDKIHVSQYRITWVISIIEFFRQYIKIESMLDPSMGWGDRLIGAMKTGVSYQGCDPNAKLHPGYQRMIQDFGSDDNIYAHREIGFEDFEVTELVDFILSSPPYGDVEVYCSDLTQSSQKYRRNWMGDFYQPYLVKCYSALRVGGIMVLQIGDNRNFKMIDHTIQFLKTIEGFSHLGQFLAYSDVGKCPNLHLIYQKTR